MKLCIVCIDNLGLKQPDLLFAITSKFRAYNYAYVLGIPPYTPTIWVSILTGKSPKVHGIGDFIDRRKGKKLKVRDIGAKYFWMNSPLKSLVFGVPMTYPAKECCGKGAVISGWDSPISSACPSLLRKYSLLDIELKCINEVWKCRRYGNIDFPEIFIKSVRLRISRINKLVKILHPHILIAFFPENDWFRHAQPCINSSFIRKKLIEMITEFIEWCTTKCEYTIVISDHDSKYFDYEINIYPYITSKYLDIPIIRKATKIIDIKHLAGRCVLASHNLLEQGIFLRHKNELILNYVSNILEEMKFRVLPYYSGRYLPDLVFSTTTYSGNAIILNEYKYWDIRRQTRCEHIPGGVYIAPKELIRKRTIKAEEILNTIIHLIK